ncbi:MAG: dTDP-glucose 4,6-dehydratase [Candidatus Micrarchaeum sp. AZ1]|jgi:dTDP-glucose 4,6-dehydratase|nr:MAG: dTDP-glucose 4,6-dehydratase [Candidatus Micrarchaeum sp. AZ1]
MKLLVTGGAGFIGSNFIHYWLAKHKKDEIINIDKFTYAANKANLSGLPKDRHTLIIGDIADKELIDKNVNDVDVVVNFAAESHVDNSIEDSGPFIHSNIVGVHTLLNSIKKYEKRFHQISTDEVYGSLPLNSSNKFTENSPYNPRNPYAATKAAADHLVRAYFNTYKIKATISNCSNNFGPRQHIEKLIPKTITNAIQNKEIPIYGNGAQVRDWIYVEDHCSAIEIILKDGRLGETYLISAQNELRNIDVVKKVLDIFGKPESLIKYVADRPGHDVRYAIEPNEIRKLGWRPKYKFDTALGQTIDWYIKEYT